MIDSDYPGGNIAVDRIDGSDVYLRQDLRDTKGWWFYWNFRVSEAAGRTITFHFTDKSVIGTNGPALSLDDGQTWSWLGRKSVRLEDLGDSFSYSFGPEADSVTFAFAIPYLQADLARFLEGYSGSRHLAVDELCKTRKGRSVERMRIGKLESEPEHRVLMTCRHHCCESIASYVLEGAVAAMLADTDTGKWFRQNVEALVIPFVDKDGVEDGDQGKNRIPRDHNRDYDGESLYPSVRALRESVPEWSRNRLKVAFDLHCPGKDGKSIHLVGSSCDAVWKEQCRFSEILANVCRDSLPFKPSDNVPFGQGWNTADSYKDGKSFAGWVGGIPGVRLPSTIEIPYANVGTVAVKRENARAFGADLLTAVCRYLANC